MQTPLESCAVIERANGRLRNESHSSSQELACPPFYSVRHERDNLMALPEGEYDLIRYYTFTESDLFLIRQRRGNANGLGFAAQLCQF
jgi:hypothetical protein